MARGHFGILASLRFFNIGEIRLETSGSRGTFQATRRVRGSKKEKFEVMCTFD